MLPASLAACVPLFIATATSACASAGASLVPSPVIATSRPSCLVLADQLELRLRRRFGEEVVDARLGGDRRRGQPVVAGDHHRLDAHAAQLGEALLDAALDDVLQLDHAQNTRRRRRPPAACCRAARLRRPSFATSVGHAAALRLDVARGSRRRRPCGSCARRGRRRSCASARRTARTSRRARRSRARGGRRLLGQHDDAAALRRLVGERGELRGIGELAARYAGRRQESHACRLPSVIVPVLSSSSTSTSPAASTARPEVAMTLAPQHPAHAGDADRRQQRRRSSSGSGTRAARPAR